MSVGENKALILRLYDCLNRKERESYYALYSPDFVLHGTSGDVSLDQMKQLESGIFDGSSKGRGVVDNIVATGDRVAFQVHVTVMQATGKNIDATNTHIVKVAGGKITEWWGTNELDYLMRQRHNEENKTALHRIMEEVWNKGNLEISPELVSPAYVYREANREFNGPAGYRTLVTNWRTAFPDAHYTIDDLVAEDDKISCRLSFRGTFKGRLGGIDPTGKEIHLAEATFSRWAGGKVVEVASFFDMLALYRQMGVKTPG